MAKGYEAPYTGTGAGDSQGDATKQHGGSYQTSGPYKIPGRPVPTPPGK